MEAGNNQTTPNLDKFFEEVDVIKKIMAEVQKLYKRLQESNEQCKVATNAKAVKETRALMDTDVEQVLKRAKVIKDVSGL